MSIFDKWDSSTDIRGLEKDVEESRKNGSGSRKEVPVGTYEVKVQSMEIKECKSEKNKGAPMVAITLNDENQTTVMISTPTKKVMSAMTQMSDAIDELEDTNIISEEMLDDMYNLCAEIMSHNKTGTKIEPELLGEIFSIDDITIFMSAYIEFVNEGEVKN